MNNSQVTPAILTRCTLKCKNLQCCQLYHCSMCVAPFPIVQICCSTSSAHNLTWLQSSEGRVAIFLVITRNMENLIATWPHAPHDSLDSVMTTSSCALVLYRFNARWRWLKHNCNVIISDSCGCSCSSSSNIDISNRSNGNQ